MQEYIIKKFENNEDIKMVYSKNSRIALIDFKKEDFKKAKEKFYKIKSDSGIYIIEFLKENEKHNKNIYVDCSDNVWTRIKKHIKNDIKESNGRISVIISTHLYNPFKKIEMYWIENSLISELNFLDKKIKSKIKNTEFKKDINLINKDLLTHEFDDIKRFLYFVGKNYFNDTFQNEINYKSNNKINNKNYFVNDQEWIEVFPIYEEKINVKFQNAKFYFNKISKKIKVYNGTVLKGCVVGTEVKFKEFNNYFHKYKFKGVIKGQYELSTGEYEIKFIKDFELSPSALSLFTRSKVSNGWIYWKDKNGKLIDEYRKNVFLNKIENKINNKNHFVNDQEWIEVFPIINEKRNVEISYGKFFYNKKTENIKVSNGTILKGCVGGAEVNFKNINNCFHKYKFKGVIKGQYELSTGQYEIKFIKDFELSPSTLSFFTRAGVCNGWMFWKDKDGKLIYEYRENK